MNERIALCIGTYCNFSRAPSQTRRHSVYILGYARWLHYFFIVNQTLHHPSNHSSDIVIIFAFQKV